MSAIKTGGSAFPVYEDCEGRKGMTLRDWFAGQALIGLMASQLERQIISGENIAKGAFNIADNMLAEREKNGY